MTRGLRSPDAPAQLAEAAAALDRLGLSEAADRVREAADLTSGNPEQAAGILREVVACVTARVPAYSHRRKTL